jgi:hypothetical protein
MVHGQKRYARPYRQYKPGKIGRISSKFAGMIDRQIAGIGRL